MKTNLINEFNMFDDDFNIDETTVCEDLGIDVEKIVRTVMNEASVKKPSRKKNFRKLPIILIAAAVSTAVIGTTVLAATGFLRASVSERYKGDTSTLQIYGDDFQFSTTDDNLDAKFLGIVGDDNFILATVELTKKDGSKFIEGDGGILRMDGYDYYFTDAKEDGKKGDMFTMKIDYPSEQSFSGKTYGPLNSEEPVEYFLSKDRKTLTLYLTYKVYGTDPTGIEVSLSSNYFKGYEYRSVLSQTVNDSKAAEFINDNDGFMLDDCFWKYEENTYTLYSIEKKHYPLPFEMHFKLDRKFDNSLKLNISSEQAPHVLAKDKNIDISISPFKMFFEQSYYIDRYIQYQVLNPEQSMTREEFENSPERKDIIMTPELEKHIPQFSAFVGVPDKHGFCEIDVDNSKIILKDGSIRYFRIESNTSGFIDREDTTESVTYTDAIMLAYSDVPSGTIASENNDKVKSCIISPDSIGEIIINGDTIYRTDDPSYVPYQNNNNTDPGHKSTSSDMYDVPLYKRNPDKLNLYTWYPDDLKRIIASVMEDADNPDLFSLSFSTGNMSEENLNILFTDIDIQVYTNKKNIRNIFNTFTKMEEYCLFIQAVEITPSLDNENYIINLSFTNPYTSVDSTTAENDIKDYIRNHYGIINWNQIVDDYIKKDKLPRGDIHFKVNPAASLRNEESVPEESEKTEEESISVGAITDQDDDDESNGINYPKPISDPVSEPEKENVKIVDLSDFSVSEWNHDLLNQTIDIMTNTNFFLSDNNSYNDDDLNLQLNNYQLSLVGTKNELFNLINNLVSLEKADMFISNVKMEETGKYNGTYSITIFLTNPVPDKNIYSDKEKAKKIILDNFGSVLKNKLFDWFLYTMESSGNLIQLEHADFYLVNYNLPDDQENPEIFVEAFSFSPSGLQSFYEFKNSVTDEKIFIISDEISVDLINTDNDDLKNSIYSVNFKLSSDEFNRR